MIPPNILYLNKEDKRFSPLKMQREVTVAAINIASIYPHGNNRVKVNFGVAIASLVPGSKVTLASTTGSLHDGTFKILFVDHTSGSEFIIIESPRRATQTGAAGTATLSGTVKTDWYNDASAYEYKNNDGEMLAYKYAATGKFVLAHGSEGKTSTVIQVINLDSTDAVAEVTVKWSLDCVHWLDFATPLASGSITAGNSYGFVIDVNAKHMFLLITVTDTAGADYTILGG